MQDLPRPILRTYRLDSMLAHLLSRMLVTMPRIEALSYMQTDHHGVGFKAYIPLTFFGYLSFGVYIHSDIEMRLYITLR